MAKTDLGKFKEQLSNLITYVDSIIPNDSQHKKEVDKLCIKLRLGIDSNPRLVMELFCENVKEFAHPILKGDDTYFLKYDYGNITKEFNAFEEIEQKLKTLWTTFNGEQQERIKRFFKLLLVLGCMGTKDKQLLDIINEYRTEPLVF